MKSDAATKNAMRLARVVPQLTFPHTTGRRCLDIRSLIRVSALVGVPNQVRGGVSFEGSFERSRLWPIVMKITAKDRYKLLTPGARSSPVCHSALDARPARTEKRALGPGTSIAGTRRHARSPNAKSGGKPWHTRPKSVVRTRVVSCF